MWPYLLMLFVPALGALAPVRLPVRQSRFMLVAVGAGLALVMGLRFEVGGDWFNYLDHFYYAQGLSFLDAIQYLGDPGYYGLGWLIARAGGSIFWLNLCCAIFLVSGVLSMARRERFPWLVVVAAVPYLLMVVGMGYTRQSAAIGFAMLGLVALGEGKVRAFLVWILLAALFHKTATLLIPIAALSVTRRKLWVSFWVAVFFALAYWTLLSESSDELVKNYIESDYADAASGAGIRVAMNFVPAVLLIFFRRKILPDKQERNLWLWLAWVALVSPVFIQISATAVDRMGLYLIPLQLLVAARLPLLTGGVMGRTLVVLAVAGYCLVVQLGWLLFAKTAFAWIPYHFMPLW